jgi:hypothetical protein
LKNQPIKKPTEEQIKEIAGSMEAGFRSFFNLKTGELKMLPALDLLDEDEESWKKVIREIEKNRKFYYEFQMIDSRESYRIMADFAESVNDKKIKENLVEALNRPKPFRNFKFQVDNSGEYRNQWFAFQIERYIEFVKKQIENNWANL